MKLNQLLQDMALGELNGSPWVSLRTYEIEDQRVPLVINALNKAMVYVYSQLPLIISSINIRYTIGIQDYVIDQKHLMNNLDLEGDRYLVAQSIDNTPLQIIGASSPALGDFLLDGESGGVYLNNATGLTITNPLLKDGDVVIVTYQASPKLIPLTEQKTSQFDVNIPPSILPIAQQYAASLAYMGMGGNHINESEMYQARSMVLLENLKQQGIGDSAITINNQKLYEGGWL